MKCTHCGAELAANDTLCGTCGKPVQTEPAANETNGTTVTAGTAAPEADASAASTAALETTEPDSPAPKKASGKMAAILIAAAAIIAAAAFAVFKMTAKDPKEVVIAAFENIWTEDQVNPTEELFGTSEFTKAVYETDTETSLTLKLDSSSDESVNAFAGTGFRFAGQNDITNQKSSLNMGLTYNDMDALNLNLFFEKDTMMAALPELVSKVLTLDLGDGLADRVKNSPTVGAYLAQNGVDVDAMASYLQELTEEAAAQAETGNKTVPFDVEALMARYKDGTKAQENFKAALIVEKNGKGSFTMDGKTVDCTGYQVTVSKDSMIEFLRVSSDFFLQDETLKQDFLKQLEASVRMSEMMGAGMYSDDIQTPEALQQQTYEEARAAVDEMIGYLDESLTDVQMVVYVDKAGRLASVAGTTSIKGDEEFEPMGADVAFEWNLEGGAYLTQNMNGNVTLTNPEDAAESISIRFKRQGVYDKASLTDDVSVDIDGSAMDPAIHAMYTASYTVEDGSYHIAAEVGIDSSQIVKISAAGTVDELEKGKTFRATIDELETSVMDNYMNIMMSGEYSFMPLQSEVAALEGEQMDVLAATPEEWQGLFMEGLFGAMSVMQELGIQ